jgi:hypothetical protein
MSEKRKGEASMIDNRTAPYAALVLRLALSFFFFAHLVRKFAVYGFALRVPALPWERVRPATV